MEIVDAKNNTKGEMQMYPGSVAIGKRVTAPKSSRSRLAYIDLGELSYCIGPPLPRHSVGELLKRIVIIALWGTPMMKA